ncbi:MAG: sensor histidine kinase [Cryomorphaceae bacterium]|nr:MAG: sensor histidine kinase [Cryomorphaceae bacterium]
MSIQRKILLYFSVTAIGLSALSLSFIYTLFYEFREEEFQQRQKAQVTNTVQYLSTVEQMESDILRAIDKISIERIYDEKTLLFNSQRELIYESLDDTSIPYFADILTALSAETPWIEQKDGLYDVIGMYLVVGGESYYGISKAYDEFGYSKLNYLRTVFIINLLIISVFIISVSFYLSRLLSRPIVDVAETIDNYDVEVESEPIRVSNSNREIDVLVKRFNQLMARMRKAFSFQKHAIHHISHELKTPVAILVSNFERMEAEADGDRLREMLKNQKQDTKALSNIIDALLEISKAESGGKVSMQQLRVDELLFDTAEDLQGLYPEFTFTIEYAGASDNESKLTAKANPTLLKSAFTNLMLNCIQYSEETHARISIEPSEESIDIRFVNKGQTIGEKEQAFLFQHFFRGENSKGKSGFGLGLVFIHKIMKLHNGAIEYNTDKKYNRFTLRIPTLPSL